MSMNLSKALSDLDQRTPEFFVREALATDDHGAAREIAIDVLQSTTGLRACSVLRELLRCEDNLREA